MAVVTATLVGMLYSLVPLGRLRQRGKPVIAALVAVLSLSLVYLAVHGPTDVVFGAIGVTIPLVAFRMLTPNEVFPVTYRRGQTAHLDVGGRRGQAIHRALGGQLGVQVAELKPFGLSGSAGSTPLRVCVKGDPNSYLFAKLRRQPSPRRPLVQAGPDPAVRPAGGREAVQHRAPPGPAGRLRPAAALWGRGAQPEPFGIVEITPSAST